MDKAEFKARWESDGGGGITFDDIAECAVEWGISLTPKTRMMERIRYDVLKAANTNDAEEYYPHEES